MKMNILKRSYLLLFNNFISGYCFSTISLPNGRHIVIMFNQCLVFVYLTSGKDAYTDIQKDLDLSNEDFALFTGTIFALTNCVFGLLMGYLADKYNRKWLLFVTAISWSVMTMASAFTYNFWEVLLPRIGFSFFEAACIPVSVSLINDYFEHDMRGRANSMFAFGIYLGGGLSSLTLLINEVAG